MATKAGNTEIRYRHVTLRDTDVNDERAAVQLSERVVMVGDKPMLLSSSDEFGFAITMKHVEELRADATTVLSGALLDLNMFGRLSPHDVGLIENRVFLLPLAAQVLYGLITEKELDDFMAGKGAAASPQPVGEAAVPAAPAAEAQSGPLLRAFTADGAGGAAAGDGAELERAKPR